MEIACPNDINSFTDFQYPINTVHRNLLSSVSRRTQKRLLGKLEVPKENAQKYCVCFGVYAYVLGFMRRFWGLCVGFWVYA